MSFTMSYLTTTTWNPNSFQLRLALNWRKSAPAVFVRVRVRKVDRRTRIFSCVAAGGGGSSSSSSTGNGVERRRISGNSWMSWNSSPEGLSQWSGSDSVDERFGDSQRLGGIVGAGVAGVILVAGLAFAALSISKRRTSGLEQQMEPLITQQEMSLVSYEHNDRVEEERNENKTEMHDNGSMENTAGIVKDPSSYTENDEAAIENRLSNDTNVEFISSADNFINHASIQPEDLQNESATNDMPVAPEATPKLHESEIAGGFFDSSSFENSDSNVIPEQPKFTTKQKDNLIDANPAHINISTDHQEGVPDSRETETSVFSADSSSSSMAPTPTEPLAFNVSVNPQLDALLEPKILHKEDIETVSSLSINDLDLDKAPEVPAEGNKSSLEVHDLNAGELFGTTSVSEVAYPFANEKDGKDYNGIDGSRSLFDSMNSGNFFTSSGIPAPSLVSAAGQVFPGKVLVPAVVDQVQGQALAALQVLKVIEADVQPGDLCTRREYARWLVSASSALSRNTVSKVYPAMYIENFTELAFDDITPEDADFPSIQGLAEAGLISSKLSRRDMQSSLDEDTSPLWFSPESTLSRQALVSWKMAVEKRQLPVADRKILQQFSGFIDIDKINPDAWPALVADLSAGELGIISLAFGYTRLFQPDKPVTKAQAAIALATGEASNIVSEELARIEAESMAEKAVAAHSALVAQVEKDVNASFQQELLVEREKIEAVEKLLEEARQELERLKADREGENIGLMKERAAVDSEMIVFSRLRREVEDQLLTLLSDKLEISYEKERLSKLRKDVEIENQEISRLQYELEVERKALSMARAWAEDEAKRAREQAKALEEARFRWERNGIKVVVDEDMREDENAGVTWLTSGNEFSVEGTVSRGENLVDKLKAMATDVGGKSRDTIDTIIQKILFLISNFKEWTLKVGQQTGELKDDAMAKVSGSLQGLQHSSTDFALAVKEGAKRVAGDCREGVEKLTQKFKT